MKKWLPIAEAWARSLVWALGIILATVTVVLILPLLKTDFAYWSLVIALILYYPAALLVLYSEARRLSSSLQSNSSTEHKNEQIARQPKQLRWLLLVVVLFVVIAVGLYFVAQQLTFDTQGYIALFAAVAAAGAWVTGIALAVFAYQQWQLRQTEHSLLFVPQIQLVSGGPPVTGPTNENQYYYPYRIEWIVSILNPSQLPVLIHQVQLEVGLAGGDRSKCAIISRPHAYILEPDTLRTPFLVSQSTPQRIRWIIEGNQVGSILDNISGDSGSRDFEIVCKIFASMLQSPERLISKELLSSPTHIPEDAGWDSSNYVAI